MNVCDYCGAVYEGEACGGCAEPHVILYFKASQGWAIDLMADNRYDAEEKFDERMTADGWRGGIVPLSLWVEAIENLLDWRP